jgi:hypothetical protein
LRPFASVATASASIYNRRSRAAFSIGRRKHIRRRLMRKKRGHGDIVVYTTENVSLSGVKRLGMKWSTRNNI